MITTSTERMPELTYDAQSDVLYVKLPGARILESDSIEGDDFVIVNKDSAGRIVGLQLIAVRDSMSLSRWAQHFQNDVPTSLFQAVARWLAQPETRRSIAQAG